MAKFQKSAGGTYEFIGLSETDAKTMGICMAVVYSMLSDDVSEDEASGLWQEIVARGNAVVSRVEPLMRMLREVIP